MPTSLDPSSLLQCQFSPTKLACRTCSPTSPVNWGCQFRHTSHAPSASADPPPFRRPQKCQNHPKMRVRTQIFATPAEVFARAHGTIDAPDAHGPRGRVAKAAGELSAKKCGQCERHGPHLFHWHASLGKVWPLPVPVHASLGKVWPSKCQFRLKTQIAGQSASAHFHCVNHG